MKKLLTILCIAVSMLVLSGCAREEVSTTDRDYANQLIGNCLDTWVESSRQDLEDFLEQCDSQMESFTEEQKHLVEGYQVYLNALDEGIGTYEDREDASFTVSGSTITADLRAHYSDRDVDFEFVFEKKGTYLYLESIAANPVYSMREKLLQAALYSLVGILLVFVVLSFISFAISLLKYVPILIDRLGKRRQEGNISEEASTKTEPLAAFASYADAGTSDAELAAVIMAAIAAASADCPGSDPGQLVVRSIRRVSSRWNRG